MSTTRPILPPGARSRAELDWLGADIRILAQFALLICVLPSAWAATSPQSPLAGPSLAAPPTPPAGTPIDFFRGLLAATPEERQRLLTGKNPDQRKVLEESLSRYDGIQPEERELRLRTMELRYRLTTLMRTPTTNREVRLRQIPERDRKVVEERLRLWDGCAPDEKKTLLENERMLRAAVGVYGPSHVRQPLTGQTSNQLHRVEEELIRWQSVPEERRARVEKMFGEIFEVEDKKPSSPMPPLPLRHEELKSIQQSLRQFRSLAPLQRDQCIRNFSKFADLTPGERRQFLASAQEWQRMAPQDREQWRKLVSRMPPLPVRLGPPLPSRTMASRAPAPEGTNIP